MTTEEKLQQTANCFDVVGSQIFMAGAKSPESLEYWKEKEKLYTEEELKEYAEKFAHFIQLENRPEGILTGWHQWFNQHKK